MHYMRLPEGGSRSLLARWFADFTIKAIREVCFAQLRSISVTPGPARRRAMNLMITVALHTHGSRRRGSAELRWHPCRCRGMVELEQTGDHSDLRTFRSCTDNTVHTCV